MRHFNILMITILLFNSCSNNQEDELMLASMHSSNAFIQNTNAHLEYNILHAGMNDPSLSTQEKVQSVKSTSIEIQNILDSINKMEDVDGEYLFELKKKIIHDFSNNHANEIDLSEYNDTMILLHHMAPVIAVNQILRLQYDLYLRIGYQIYTTDSNPKKLPIFKTGEGVYLALISITPVFQPLPTKISILEIKYGDVKLSPDKYSFEQTREIVGVKIDLSKDLNDTISTISINYVVYYKNAGELKDPDHEGTAYFTIAQ